MKKFILNIILSLIVFNTFADGGMWMVNLIGKYQIKNMKKLGCKLSAKDIYSINSSSLKDAIVALDHGSCTGSIVSDKSLLFTNYHCAFDDVQALCSIEKDYLSHGFWAKKSSEEIVIPGKTVSFLDKIVDVTPRVKELINQESKKGRKGHMLMRRVYKLIERELSAKTDLEVSVNAIFLGKQYFAYYYKTYKDIRLVGVPSESIGMFGGDTDNWTWPQHRADFAVYRIYADANGNPAKYSPNNKPLKAKKHLKISLKGVKKGDFSMVMGYPYRTSRYKSSFGIKEKINIKNPAIIDVRTQKLALMKEMMRKDNAMNILYASRYFGLSNHWKFVIGESKCVKDYNVVSIKENEEEAIRNYQNKKYAYILDSLNSFYNQKAKYTKTEYWFREAIINGSELSRFAMQLKGIETILKKSASSKVLNKRLIRLQDTAKELYNNINIDIEKKLIGEGIKFYITHVDSIHQPKELLDMFKVKAGGDFKKLTDYVFDNSLFSSYKKLVKFANTVKQTKKVEDTLYSIIKLTLNKIYKNRKISKAIDAKILEYKKKYVHAFLDVNKKKQFAPDANSTMRYTYGTIGGYSPKDGVDYRFYSTASGYLQKSKLNNPDYKLDARIKELILDKNYGRYAGKDKHLHTGFISNNDITGGNSGSPVLNAKGKMIGIAFDGNWESMSGDLYFHPKLNKTVSVDIRFVLWFIDVYAQCNYLIKEMKI